MIWTLFGCLACLAIGIIVGWVACRISEALLATPSRRKQHVTPAVPQPLTVPQPKPTTPAKRPFDKKDRSTWPVVEAEAIPELRKQPALPTRVRTLQTRLAYATELLDIHGLGAEFREGIEELEETG